MKTDEMVAALRRDAIDMEREDGPDLGYNQIADRLESLQAAGQGLADRLEMRLRTPEDHIDESKDHNALAKWAPHEKGGA